MLVVKWTLIDIHNGQYCHLLGCWLVSFLCSLSIWWSKIILMYVVWLHFYRKYYNILYTICPVNFIFLFKNLLPMSSKLLLYVSKLLWFYRSASAFFVTQTLRSLSRDGRTVIASIHQPSSEVFELFDQLYLLSGGKTVYFGQASEAYEVGTLSLCITHIWFFVGMELLYR